MKNKMDNRRNQRGVALLFALGILSLLLIFGLAFVTNALLSQKIAGNNRSRSQAKMLAQSAISRMAISMMFYQYEAANAGFIPLNYMDVHSFYDLNGTPGKTPSALEATDGLRGGAGSILVSNMNLTNYDLAREDHQKAQWSYITAKDDSGENKIVGRIAYQVLPSNASAHINLDHALRGVYDSGDPLRKPWSVRIGADINELNLDATTVFNDWENSHAPSDPDNMTAATFDAFFSAYKDSLFAGTPAEKTEKETWVRRWFADGTVAADSEYYRDDSGSKPKFYHRFNLGKIDPEAVKPDTIVDQWYDRLDISGADKNSQNAVEKLAGNSEVFKITDKWTPGGIGLPFLKFIANDKGTFADLENRRRQIAANLNDYCDEDSIPTSNVDAKTWGDILDSSTPDTSWPKYTGNEKTPYINEFAFGFKVTPALVAGKSSGGIDTSKAAISLKLDRVELIAELVKIYENLQNLKDYKLATYLQEFSIGFKATAKIKITYTEGDPPETKTLEQDVPVMTSGSFLCDPQKVEISFKSSASNWKNGYIVDAVELVLKDMSSTAGFSAQQTYDFDFTEQGKALLPGGGTLTKIEVSTVKLEVIEPKFSLSGIALIDISDGSTPPVEVGVDFVRWPAGKLPVANLDQVLFKNANVSNGDEFKDAAIIDTLEEQYKYFYLGGMQVRDPRQNLNVDPSATSEKESDWSRLDQIKLADYNNKVIDNGEKVMTIKTPYDDGTPVGDVNKVQDRLLNGEVNSEGVPKKESSPGVFDPEYDPESALDPVWRESSQLGIDEKNLSTAYIRNAPMRSLWELGAIHRGAAWETLNLKLAMKPNSDTDPISNKDMKQPGNSWGEAGTTYLGGDGGILEQVKLTDQAYTYGKLNVNMLSSNLVLNPDYTSRDDEMGRALFYGVKHGQTLEDLDDFSSTNGTLIDWASTANVAEPMRNAVDQFKSDYPAYSNVFDSRAQFLTWQDSSGNCLANGFGIILETNFEKLTDIQQEELVGKTINLIKGTNSASNMIRFIVIAQTIRDNTGTIARLKYDGDLEVKDDCKYGQFDISSDSSVPGDFPENDKYLYFDEITGEVKLLVTMENNPITGQTIVRQIEYLD